MIGIHEKAFYTTLPFSESLGVEEEETVHRFILKALLLKANFISPPLLPLFNFLLFLIFAILWVFREDRKEERRGRKLLAKRLEKRKIGNGAVA